MAEKSCVAAQLMALCAGRSLLTRNIIFLFLVLISVRGWVNPRSMVWLEGLAKLKKFIRLIGSRNRDLKACRIVPQPTMLPRAHLYVRSVENSISTRNQITFRKKLGTDWIRGMFGTKNSVFPFADWEQRLKYTDSNSICRFQCRANVVSYSEARMRLLHVRGTKNRRMGEHSTLRAFVTSAPCFIESRNMTHLTCKGKKKHHTHFGLKNSKNEKTLEIKG
jgi:hypothetical protein